MCNQNIGSNKFDLKLVTTFSSYWCTAIFTKSRSLHYVLKKQRKSIQKWINDTEGGTTVSYTITLKRTTSENRMTLTDNSQVHSKDLRIRTQKGWHSRNKRRFQNRRKTRRNRTSISASQNGTHNNDIKNDTHRNSQTTARIWKTTGV